MSDINIQHMPGYARYSHPKLHPNPVGFTGNTYYVDATGGNDLWAGTYAAPWQSITKVNSATLYPGDRVLFKCGEVFIGRLIPVISGVDGAPIIYGAYGSGARPIINGSSSSAFYIYTGALQHYLRVESIDFAGATGSFVSTVMMYGHDFYAYDCIMRDATGSGANGFAASSNPSDGANNYNIVLDHCYIYNNTGDGVYIGSDLGTYGPHDCEVKYCDVYGNGYINPAYHGIYVRHGVDIHHNRCWSNGGDGGGGSGIKCNTEGVTSYKSRVWNNEVWDNDIGLYVTANGSKWWNNHSRDNYTANLMYVGGPFDTTNTEVYFNTLVNCYHGYGVSAVGANPGTGNSFRDNIVIQDHAVVPWRIPLHANNTVLNTMAAMGIWDYNIYYFDGNATHDFGDATDGAKTFSQWQALSGSPDAHSTLLTSLPGFVTRYTNVHPSDGGNLKGSGLAITGYETDKDDNTRADPPTRGCYEEASA